MLLSTIDLDNEKPMVITASSMCKDSSTSSSCYPVYGINENWTGRMVVADASYVHYYDTNPYAHFRSIMVHEIGHNYGTPDHYNDTVDPC
ncbi:MAG: hypothetical protein IJJ69_05805, partial [Oscillospiraceae bacterium]|nr:hypothetical protein [Oscillospiraceae bacterium]